jgi:hypothetical protein
MNDSLGYELTALILIPMFLPNKMMHRMTFGNNIKNIQL